MQAKIFRIKEYIGQNLLFAVARYDRAEGRCDGEYVLESLFLNVYIGSKYQFGSF